ncbi:T9SS type A sorting domain-containing protein [Soonwooa sp.]|uniref:T9SS type A sorting domain-containing protein n=1 Tax=Soonwooa sp. TaxID=1938592 RepID=UPI002638ADB1|nr:T9SS type A sorting domain-containing protein [Soonwooa sp.]
MKIKNLSIKMLLMMGLFSLPTHAQVYMIGTRSNDVNNTPFANGVSDDGKVIGLNSTKQNYIWTEADGIKPVGQLISVDDYSAGSVNITSDGKKAVMLSGNMASGTNQISVYNISNNTWDYLGSKSTDYNTDLSVPYAITPDASVIVGTASPDTYAYSRGIYWKAGNDNFQTLPSLYPDEYFAAWGVSADSKVMVGYQDNQNGTRLGCIWKDGVQTIIVDSNNKPVTSIQTVSGDGKWALGRHGIYAMKWSEATGVVDLVDPNAATTFTGLTTSSNYDASLIVGYYKSPNAVNPGNGQGFLWTEKTGFKNLNDLVKDLGFDDLGIRFAVPLKVSTNGKHIVGIGVTSTGNVAFKITLPDSFMATLNTTKASVDVKIYPNPAQDILKIDTKENISKYEIYDMAGKVVLRNDFKSAENSIDVSKLPKSTYILKMTIDGKEVSKTFIKK